MNTQKIKNIQAIVLAAGKSTRFKTQQSKLCHTICGLEAIMYPLQALSDLEQSPTVVVGHQAEEIRDTIGNYSESGDYYDKITFVEQKEQRGTGHALASSMAAWCAPTLLVMYGDMPALSKDIINEFITYHQQERATISLMTAIAPSRQKYGRIDRSNGRISIIEAPEDPDYALYVSKECEINAGVYLFDTEFVKTALQKLSPSAVKGELYLTDLIAIAGHDGFKVSTMVVPFNKVLGFNTLYELAFIEEMFQQSLLMMHMNNGVRIINPSSVTIDYDVMIGSDTVIEPGVILKDGTMIGQECYVGAYSYIENTDIGERSVIAPYTLLIEQEVEADSYIEDGAMDDEQE